MSKTIQYKDYLKQSLGDTKEAAEYLNAALETGDLPLVTLALKDVVDALEKEPSQYNQKLQKSDDR